MTYRIGRLVPGEVHRVQEVHQRPGGKGVNVARVLHQLGEAVVVTGFADAEFGASVEAAGLQAAFVPALPSVRRTVVVHGDDVTTSLWEPGMALIDPGAASDSLGSRVSTLLGNAAALVVSGSLPPGVDPELPVRLAALAQSRGVPVILDLDHAALRAAADHGHSILVPNLEELAMLVPCVGDFDVVEAAQEVGARTHAPVVVTLGAAGMVAATPDACWHVQVAEQAAGNPTGAGDAATAAIALRLAGSATWPEILADAVALSAAAVVAPVAGEIDLESYRRWRPVVKPQRVDSLMIRKGTP